MRTIRIDEMRERLTDMAAYLDKLCDENGLTLFMSGGTLSAQRSQIKKTKAKEEI